MTPIGTTIFQNIKANDIDSGVNSLAEYFIVEGDGKNIGIDSGIGNNRVNTADGFGYFSINLPHQGQVTVNRSLDYEKTQRYLVTIVASVSGSLFILYFYLCQRDLISFIYFKGSCQKFIGAFI